jgi:hypothetical protein
MLESMLGPDVMKKIIAKLAALICVILGWIGLIMVMMTAIVGLQVDLVDANGSYVETVTRVGLHHAHLWPMLIGFFCAGAALVMGDKKVKMSLSYVLLLVSLWVMVNTILQKIPGPSLQGMGMAEGVAPLMVSVAAIGGFLGILGGVVGIMGAGKYSK